MKTTFTIWGLGLSLRGLGLSLISSATFAQANPKCRFVNLRAEVRHEDKIYVQHSIAWVIGTDTGKFGLLAPAHALAGATQLSAHCHDQELSLRTDKVTQSDTFDLAWIELDKQAIGSLLLRPAFHLNDVGPVAPATSEQLINVAHTNPFDFASLFPASEISPVEVRASLLIPRSKQADEILNSPRYAIMRKTQDPLPIPAYKQNLVVHYTAARPGFSGGPVIKRGDLEGLPLGMVLMTEINGHKAVGAPISEILIVARALAAGKDPWRIQHPKGPWLEFFTEREGSTLLQKRRLVSSQGTHFRESCGRSLYLASSQWVVAGGGDWGDGGGGPKSLGFRFSDPPNHERGLILRLLQNESGCHSEGLVWKDREILGVVDNQEKYVLRILGTSDLLELATLKGPSLESYLDTKGFFKDAKGRLPSDYSALCQPYIFGPNMALTETGSKRIENFPVAFNGHYALFHPETTLVAPAEARNAHDWASVSCSRNRKTVQSTFIGGRDQVMWNLKILPTSVTGKIILNRKCAYDVKIQSSTTYWSRWIGTEDGELLAVLRLGVEVPLEIKFLRIPAHCATTARMSLINYSGEPLTPFFQWLEKQVLRVEAATFTFVKLKERP